MVLPGFPRPALKRRLQWVSAFEAVIGTGGLQTFNTENYRMQIAGGDILIPAGGLAMRLWLYSHPSHTITISAITVQQCASGWTATNPDFASSPVPVTDIEGLSGPDWVLAQGGGPYVTVPIALGITAGMLSNGLGIAFKFNNGSNRQLPNGTTGSGVNAGYKTVADETGTVDVGSYVSSTDNYKQVVCGKVEVLV